MPWYRTCRCTRTEGELRNAESDRELVSSPIVFSHCIGKTTVLLLTARLMRAHVEIGNNGFNDAFVH